MHFRRSADGVYCWPLQDRATYFFVIIFWWIFNDLEWFLHPWREQSNSGNDKNTTFLCIFIGRSMACVSDHCNIGIHVFSWSFCDDLNCILASFCMILASRLQTWSRSTNGARSNSKRVIFIIFWSVFCTGKISLPKTFAGFPEKWGQNFFGKKCINFGPFVLGD